jgi:hypothetical protein
LLTVIVPVAAELLTLPAVTVWHAAEAMDDVANAVVPEAMGPTGRFANTNASVATLVVLSPGDCVVVLVPLAKTHPLPLVQAFDPPPGVPT